MNIHHATIKKAEGKGIILDKVLNEEGNYYASAKWPQYNKVVSHSDPKTALAAMELIQTLHREYPGISIDYRINTQDWIGKGPNNEEFPLGDEFPTLEVILEAAMAEGIDPEEGFEDEDEPRGNVVPTKYKIEYAARGNRNHCGDWLSLQLEGQFQNKGGQFNEPDFTQFLIDNGVELVGKWSDLPTSGQRSWEGRYRMNGRQKLERVLVQTGVLHLNGAKIKVDLQWAKKLSKKFTEIIPFWDN